MLCGRGGKFGGATMV